MNHFFCFYHATPSTQIYTLSLPDALPISVGPCALSPKKPGTLCSRTSSCAGRPPTTALGSSRRKMIDRKSTRLNSSHTVISYAVFCLKKKNKRTDRARADTSPREDHGE